MKNLKQLLFPTIIFNLIFAGCKTTTNEKKELPAPIIEMKSFFKNGDKTSFKISPSGLYYSFRADYKGKMNIFVQKIGDNKSVRVTNDTVRSINQYLWKGDHIIYFQDIGGDENFQVFSVNADGSNVKALTPFAGNRADLIDDLRFIKGKEKVILVQINKRDKQYFDPYQINVETGELTLLYKNNLNFDSWNIDNKGVIRIATKTDGVNISYLYRNSEKEDFKQFLKTNFKQQFYPQSFDSSNKFIYVMSNIGRDKISLIEYDPILKKERKELFANPDYDLDHIVYDRKKKTLLSVSWTADKPQEHYFDKDWESISEDLKNKFKNYQVEIVGWDDEHKNGIIVSRSDKLRAKFFAFDFNSKEIKELSNPYPWLNENDMAEMKPVTYQTRDGLTIHGYLTLPKNIEAKNLPVVINPHGGPWARDEWYFDPEVQFFGKQGIWGSANEF